MNSGIKRNYEGGIGYEMTLKEKITEFFSLGLLNGTFYQDEVDVLNDARELFEEALDNCSEFATKAAIYGNNVNSLKLVPTIWLVYLSTLEDKTLFNVAFDRIIRNPKMLYDFMEMSRKSGIREGLGRSTKKTMNNWLNNHLNEYQVSRNKSKLKDIVKVTRPYNNDEEFQNYMRYISKDELTFERAIALKSVINELLNDNVDEEVISLINKHRLQLDELKHSTMNLSQENKEELYYEMYKGLNYNALILNLVALERVFAVETEKEIKNSIYGQFKQEKIIKSDLPKKIIDMVVGRINDLDLYRKSNMLPFGLFNAYNMVSTNEFKDAISRVIETMSRETFNIDKDISLLVGVDTSASMGSMVSNTLSAMDIATLFGAMIRKSHLNSSIYAVATTIEGIELDNEQTVTVFEMAKNIADADVGYGTYFEQIMKHYNGEKYIILITDNMYADELEKAWLKAKKPKGAKLIVWQLVAYQTKASNDKSVIHLAGYSDRLLALVKNIIEGKAGQIEEIEKISLARS